MSYQRSRLGLTADGVNALFGDRVRQRVAPSTAYAIFDADGIVYHGGFGEVDGSPPSTDTAYRIASCTKSFTAAAVLILIERGRLSLDDPIDAYVDLGRLTGPAADSLPSPTVRQLLSMAGGLPTDDPWADRQESMSWSDFDRLIGAGIRFIARPGERYEYSNLGFALLGRMITAVSGRDYVDFVTEELINGLGLRGIGYRRGTEASGGVADGYRDVDGEWQRLPFTEPGSFSAIGGIVSTARALAEWASWLNSDTDDRLLSVASRQLMQRQHTSIGDRQGYGLGLVLDDHPRHGRIVSHSGGYPGYGSHLRWHAGSGIGIVAFENATYSRPMVPAVQALELILDQTIRPEREPDLWPETAAARSAVERLLHRWDEQLAADLFADNVELDESLQTRRQRLAALATEVDLDPNAGEAALVDASPRSRTPAHLSWTVPGRRGLLRCEIQLTPQQPPRVQTLRVSATGRPD